MFQQILPVAMATRDEQWNLCLYRLSYQDYVLTAYITIKLFYVGERVKTVAFSASLFSGTQFTNLHLQKISFSHRKPLNIRHKTVTDVILIY
jgi:hypothetical protein